MAPRQTVAKITAKSNKSENPLTASKINGDGGQSNGSSSGSTTRILRNTNVGMKRTRPQANNDGTEEEDEVEINEPAKVNDQINN